MRVVIQRVNEASVRVDGEIVGSISKGLLVFLGITHGDDMEGDELERVFESVRDAERFF